MTSEPRAKNRAPSGAGSVRQRGTTWTAAWSFADPATGKRVQRSKGGFRLQREAQAHINAQLTKIDDGSYRDRPDVRWTVADLLSAWLTERELRGVKPSTLGPASDLSGCVRACRWVQAVVPVCVELMAV